MGYSSLWRYEWGPGRYIGMLIKTMVYRWASYHETKRWIPEAAYNQAILAAELRPNQNRSGLMPPYEALRFHCASLCGRRKRRDEIAELA